MRRSARNMVLTLGLAAACTGFGCEDSAARRRADVQETIVTAARDLRAADAKLGAGPEVQAQFRQVVTSLRNTTDGEPAQRAAADRLAATAHRALASIAKAEAARLESENRSRRTAAHGLIGTAVRLDALATGLESIDVRAEFDRLDEARHRSEDDLDQYSRELAVLDRPVSELTEQNRMARTDVDRLRTEANRLRRDSSDLGPAHGFGAFEESLELDRQADLIEHEIAQRELELRFSLEPDHERAAAAVARTQTQIEQIDDARRSIQEFTDAMAAEAGSTRDAIAEHREELATTLGEIEQTSAGLLDEYYNDAATNLEQAAAKSKSAARMARDDADVARIEATRAYIDLGELWSVRARGLGGQIALGRRLDQTPASAIGAGGLSTADLESAHQEALRKAREAYGNARETLKSVSGRTARAELDRLNANLDRLLASTAADTPPPDAPAPPARGGGEPAPTASGGEADGNGAATPADLVAAIGAAGDLEAQTALAARYTHVDVETREQQDLWTAISESSRASAELDGAIRNAFGTGLVELGGQMMGVSSDLAGVDAAELGQVDGDRGTIRVTAQGQSEDLPIVRVAGRWYIDATEQFAAVAEQLGASDPLSSVQATAFIQSITEAMSGLTKRVGGGEFATAQEVMVALGQAMGPVMANMPGGP